jgi:hypothetical protein
MLIQRVRVLGGPDWADSDPFDIVAKAASAEATLNEIRSVLQTVLAASPRKGLVTCLPTRWAARWRIRLGSKKKPVEFLVIDHAEKPSSNSDQF